MDLKTTTVKTLSGDFDVKSFKDGKGTIWYSADDILIMLGYAKENKSTRVASLYNKSGAVSRVTPSQIVEYISDNNLKAKRVFWNTNSFSYLQGVLRSKSLERWDMVTESIKQVGKCYPKRETLTLGKKPRMTKESVKTYCDKAVELNTKQDDYTKFLANTIKSLTEKQEVNKDTLVTTLTYPKGFTEVTWDQYLINRYRYKVRNAKERGISFNLTFSEFKEIFSYHHCYYTGKEMVFQVAEGGNLPSRYATIERIDSKGNYDKNNTVLCCKAINDFKSVFEGTDTPFKLKDIVRMADKMKQHIDFT